MVQETAGKSHPLELCHQRLPERKWLDHGGCSDLEGVIGLQGSLVGETRGRGARSVYGFSSA